MQTWFAACSLSASIWLRAEEGEVGKDVNEFKRASVRVDS